MAAFPLLLVNEGASQCPFQLRRTQAVNAESGDDVDVGDDVDLMNVLTEKTHQSRRKKPWIECRCSHFPHDALYQRRGDL